MSEQILIDTKEVLNSGSEGFYQACKTMEIITRRIIEEAGERAIKAVCKACHNRNACKKSGDVIKSVCISTRNVREAVLNAILSNSITETDIEAIR
jgi:pantoate kinase